MPPYFPTHCFQGKRVLHTGKSNIQWRINCSSWQNVDNQTFRHSIGCRWHILHKRQVNKDGRDSVVKTSTSCCTEVTDLRITITLNWNDYQLSELATTFSQTRVVQAEQYKTTLNEDRFRIGQTHLTGLVINCQQQWECLLIWKRKALVVKILQDWPPTDTWSLQACVHAVREKCMATSLTYKYTEHSNLQEQELVDCCILTVFIQEKTELVESRACFSTTRGSHINILNHKNKKGHGCLHSLSMYTSKDKNMRKMLCQSELHTSWLMASRRTSTSQVVNHTEESCSPLQNAVQNVSWEPCKSSKPLYVRATIPTIWATSKSVREENREKISLQCSTSTVQL